MKRSLPLGMVLLAVLGLTPTATVAQKTTPTEMSAETAECIECHANETRGIYQEWGTSKHYRANVGCYECHRAEDGERRRLRPLRPHDQHHRLAQGLRALPRAGGRRSSTRATTPRPG